MVEVNKPSWLRKTTVLFLDSAVVLPLYLVGVVDALKWFVRRRESRRPPVESHPVLGNRLLMDRILHSLDPGGRDIAACQCVCHLWRDAAVSVERSRSLRIASRHKGDANGDGRSGAERRRQPKLATRMHAMLLLWIVLLTASWVVRTEGQVLTLLLSGIAPLVSDLVACQCAPPQLSVAEGYWPLVREMCLPFSVAMACSTLSLMATHAVLLGRLGPLAGIAGLLHSVYLITLLLPGNHRRSTGNWIAWRVFVLSAAVACFAPACARLAWSPLNVAWSAGLAAAGAALLWGSIVASFCPDGVATSDTYGSYHADKYRLGGVTLGIIFIAFARQCCLSSGGPYASGWVYFATMYALIVLWKTQ